MLRSSRGRLLQVEVSPFIQRFVEEHGGVILAVYALLMTIPRMFEFHMKLRRDFVVDLYVIRKKSE
jgi:predicted RNA methylase